MCAPVCNLIKGTISYNDQSGTDFRKMLRSQGFAYPRLPKTLFQAKLTIPMEARSVNGIALKNTLGGFEFYSAQLAPAPVTVNTPGYLFFPAVRGQKTRSCCIFKDFLDYMSYITLTYEDKLTLPVGCDCFVLNNIKNFPTLILDIEEYENIYCLFPTDDLSVVMFNTLKTRNPLRVHLLANSYSSSGSLYNHLQKTKN